MEPIFFQREHKKFKFFLVALVSDYFGYVFSGPIYNKHFIYGAIENDNTIGERRSKIIRNRVFDCCLLPHCKLFLVALFRIVLAMYSVGLY